MNGVYTDIRNRALRDEYKDNLVSEENLLNDESEFLNSRPGSGPLIGIVPMTGKGIEAEVDDLDFVYN